MIRRAVTLTVALSSLSARPLVAQPSTDIYLAEFGIHDGRRWVGSPRNITARDGYDNQPHFQLDGTAILYTSIDPASGQAEIYVHEIASGTNSRLTWTAESEYSPAVTPAGFSVVRVELDSTQRLWEFDSSGAPRRVLLPAVQPVGYYAWCDSNTVALFLVHERPRLALARVRDGSLEELAEGIGRSLQKSPVDAALTFVHKSADAGWWIKRLDLATLQVEPLVRTLPESEDFAWAPDGSLLMAQGAKLFAWNASRSGEWEEVADFSAHGVNQITRIAVSPAGDRLAFVASRAPREGPP